MGLRPGHVAGPFVVFSVCSWPDSLDGRPTPTLRTGLFRALSVFSVATLAPVREEGTDETQPTLPRPVPRAVRAGLRGLAVGGGGGVAGGGGGEARRSGGARGGDARGGRRRAAGDAARPDPRPPRTRQPRADGRRLGEGAVRGRPRPVFAGRIRGFPTPQRRLQRPLRLSLPPGGGVG